VPGEELAVPGGEDLVAVGPVIVELARHHRALHGPGRAADGLVGGLDLDLFEGDGGDVLGPVDVADLGIGRHDHLGRPFPARQPAAERAVDEAGAVVVVDVLAEVPDRAVVGLGVVVERGLQ